MSEDLPESSPMRDAWRITWWAAVKSPIGLAMTLAVFVLVALRTATIGFRYTQSWGLVLVLSIIIGAATTLALMGLLCSLTYLQWRTNRRR
jgi:hypothetical protein